MKILVADDDLISRKLLKNTLEKWGHEVFQAENGEEAWKLLQTNDIKFVIVDWLMPVMDGLALCRKIRSSGSLGYVYIILLTGKDKKEDLIEGLDAGADDYIAKPFDRDELRVKSRAAVRILALEKELIEKNENLSVLNDKLEKLAKMDTLMEIGNRRSFYETIEKVHYRAWKYSQVYGIIMCDIDNFKAYNDIYGHLAGDNILKTVADNTKLMLLKSEDLFRYGGEEIVAILPEQDLNETVLLAERIRKRIESLAIDHKGNNSGMLTISCGASAYDPKKTNRKWEIILDFADKALYSAKNSGKNKTCRYEDS
ncbi:MAG: diguanylate cyclase [bacterium]